LLRAACFGLTLVSKDGTAAGANSGKAEARVLFKAFGGVRYGRLLDRLGKPWKFTSPGYLRLKDISVGVPRSSRKMTDALARMISVHKLQPAQVRESSTLAQSPNNDDTLLQPPAQDGIGSQVQHGVLMAIILRRGQGRTKRESLSDHVVRFSPPLVSPKFLLR